MNVIKKSVADLIGTYKNGLDFLKTIEQDCNESGNFQSIENYFETIKSNERLITLYGSVLEESFTMVRKMRTNLNVPAIENANLDTIDQSMDGGSSSAAVDHETSVETKFEQVDLTSQQVSFTETVTVMNSQTKIHRRKDSKLKIMKRKKRGAHLPGRYVQQVRDGDIQFTKVRKTKCTTGMCFFCEKTKSLNKSQWQRHLIYHTKENFCFCHECGLSFDKRKGHPCSPTSVQNIYQRNDCLGDGYLEAFLCKVCNFVQVSESKMRAHLRNEHTDVYDAPEDASRLYKKFKFVTNL